MSNEVVLLLAGAAIALGSSLITTVFTTFLKHRMDKRVRTEEKTEQAHHLMGKMSVLVTDEQGDWIITWQKQSQKLDEFLRVSKHDPNKLSGLIGLIEAGLEHRDKFEKKTEILEAERDKLEKKVQRLEAERCQLEAEHSRLETERCQLEAEHARLESEQEELKSEQEDLKRQARDLESQRGRSP